ncbi:MAG: ORF6N domain-containing protein [Bacteroidales bacterium]|nr:ORF6N domain-containing protein [Bacteroidales bacterium]
MSKDVVITKKQVEDRIFTVRGKQVMTDYHLAELYGVETKRLNERVKRNNSRFPESFMCKVTEAEWEHLRSQFATGSRN